MKDSEKNRDPARAVKRATADLGCAGRKLVPALRKMGKGSLASELETLISDVKTAMKEGN